MHIYHLSTVISQRSILLIYCCCGIYLEVVKEKRIFFPRLHLLARKELLTMNFKDNFYIRLFLYKNSFIPA